MKPVSLECQNLDVRVAGRLLVAQLDLRLTPGSRLAVLGCNGAGKTSTLHTLAGILKADNGTIKIAGRVLSDWPRKNLARKLGLLMQNYDHPFPADALSSVMIGRHPHIGFLQWETAKDTRLARAALEKVGLQAFADRDVSTLSGGELRRLAIATLIAQDPEVVLLDEPANHLDLNHQLMVLRLFSDKASSGRCIVVSLHDVNLARRFCDQALLLFGDGDWLSGPVAEVVNEKNLSRLYRTPVTAMRHEGRELFFAA